MIKVVNANLEARTAGQTHTIISILSRFTGEIYPPVYPGNIKRSVIPRDWKAVKKQDYLPELFTLKLGEASYKADLQLEAIRDMLVMTDPNFAEKLSAMGGYLGQYTNDYQVRDDCLWMDERLAIPILLH